MPTATLLYTRLQSHCHVPMSAGVFGMKYINVWSTQHFDIGVTKTQYPVQSKVTLLPIMCVCEFLNSCVVLHMLYTISASVSV